MCIIVSFCFQAEDGIRDRSPSRGLGDVYKRTGVYLTPRTAFCWFDRPPGINRIIGIPWTAKTFYPDLFGDIDLEGLVREYHETFIHVSLTDDQIHQILNP